MTAVPYPARHAAPRRHRARALLLAIARKLRTLVPRRPASSRPGPPASGAGPAYFPRRDGLITVSPRGKISIRPAAPTLTDMTVTVRRPEYDTTPVGAITGAPRWLRDTPAEGIAVIGGPFEYREGER